MWAPKLLGCSRERNIATSKWSVLIYRAVIIHQCFFVFFYKSGEQKIWHYITFKMYRQMHIYISTKCYIEIFSYWPAFQATCSEVILDFCFWMITPKLMISFNVYKLMHLNKILIWDISSVTFTYISKSWAAILYFLF